jgi:glycosyltransferase involved in cell wall biosynthesis
VRTVFTTSLCRSMDEESLAAPLPATRTLDGGARPGDEIELSILMPCLNEAQTLPNCIDKAKRFLSLHGIFGEILVADNGSTDGSRSLAIGLGARVITVTERGYGAALRAGIVGAKGRFVIMGDSDDSYDFSALLPFLTALRGGHDLVVGNRFMGGIAPGAMPWLHRYLGNPVLSFLGRRFFGGPLRDFHCGLRGFRRESMLTLNLVTPGMEFASEMIVKSLQARLSVVEVPTTLSKDGRDRPPHLNTWRDGWRHLRYLMLYSPRWLFLYPGLAVGTLGLLQLVLARALSPSAVPWPVGIHAQLFGAGALVLGYQTVLFAMGAVLARDFAQLDSPHPRDQWARRWGASIWLPAGGAFVSVVGLVLCVALTWRWTQSGFGALDPEHNMRQLIPGVAMVLVGTQSLLASVFFAAMRSAFDSSRVGNWRDAWVSKESGPQ